MVKSASRALAYAALPSVAVSASDLAALIAAVEEAPAEVKRLRRVLPQSWAAILQESAQGAQTVLHAAWQQLHGSRGTAGERLALLTDALEQQEGAEQAAAAGCTCTGCGQRALGLRRCARCKQAACELGLQGGY